MPTLAVFKDRKKLLAKCGVASASFPCRDHSSLPSKNDLALCDMSLRLRESHLYKIAVHTAKATTGHRGRDLAPFTMRVLDPDGREVHSRAGAVLQGQRGLCPKMAAPFVVDCLARLIIAPQPERARAKVQTFVGRMATARYNRARLTDRRIRRLRAPAPFISRNRELPRPTRSGVHAVLLPTRRAYRGRRDIAPRTFRRRCNRKGSHAVIKAQGAVRWLRGLGSRPLRLQASSLHRDAWGRSAEFANAG
jgi:hypothetical protein